MDYFSLLQLKKEPFSNSPDPDFFYQAPGHVACLQQVELVIRLRQGLAVVLGDVGTGKTTICRQLIRRLAADGQVDTHLILDPAFGSAREFLETITATFDLAPPEQQESDRQVKERLKTFLFDRAVTQGRIVVLLIDEGQKLPQYCLEILRELLNYETNNAKLLQTVIFAQEEFRDQMAAMPNFADRIACLYHLAPLDFQETREMIRFRLQQASDNQRMAPELFNLPAVFLIWRLTRGYPRKIVMLCSKALLTMIIQNSSRVGALLVLACYRRARGDGRRWATAILAVLLAAGLLAGVASLRQGTPPAPAKLTSPSAPAAVARRPLADARTAQKKQETTIAPRTGADAAADAAPTAVAVATPPPQAAHPPASTPPASKKAQQEQDPTAERALSAAAPPPAAAAPSPPAEQRLPARLGQIRLQKGDSLSKMIARLYGRYTPANLRLVRRANPRLRDINTIGRGTAITFPPAPGRATPPPADGRYRLRLGRFSSLEAAYALVRRYQADLPPLRILAMLGQDGAIRFSVVVERSFADRASAQRLQQQIERLGQSAEIFNQWEPGFLLLTPPPE